MFDDFRGTKEFVSTNPTILKTDDNLFFDEAKSAMRDGNVQRAGACVQRAITLRNCSDLTAGGRREYLANLLDEASSVRRSFNSQYETVYAFLEKSVVPPNQQLPAQSPGQMKTREEKDKSEYYSPPSRNRAVFEVVSHGNSLGQVEGHLSTGETSRPGEIPSVTNPGGNSIGSMPSYRSWEGQSRKLSQRYFVRDNARDFFQVGRVFALVWHQAAGTGISKERQEKWPFSKDCFGQSIYCGIRRMIVVLEKHGHSLCVPISTYGDRGIAKSGLSKEDIAAHAYVYDSRDKINWPKDKYGLTKDAIAVDLDSGQQLREKSLIHFGKVHTVEWNLRVMSIGKVANRSRDRLLAYFQDEVTPPKK